MCVSVLPVHVSVDVCQCAMCCLCTCLRMCQRAVCTCVNVLPVSVHTCVGCTVQVCLLRAATLCMYVHMCVGLPAAEQCQGDPRGLRPCSKWEGPAWRRCAEPGSEGLRRAGDGRAGAHWVRHFPLHRGQSQRLSGGHREETLTRFSASSIEDLSGVFSCFCRNKGACHRGGPAGASLPAGHHPASSPRRRGESEPLCWAWRWGRGHPSSGWLLSLAVGGRGPQSPPAPCQPPSTAGLLLLQRGVQTGLGLAPAPSERSLDPWLCRHSRQGRERQPRGGGAAQQGGGPRH